MTTIEEFDKWPAKDENMNLEFKSAGNKFDHSKELPDYCAALANEGGGKLILNHLRRNKGYRHDLIDAFPELSPMDISNLLQELKRDNKIVFSGTRKSGYRKLFN